VDPAARQRRPDRGLAGVLGQANAVRAMAEHVHGVRHLARRERGGQAIGVLGRNVYIFGGVPDEERRRLRRNQRIQRGRPSELRAGVLAQENQPGRTVGFGSIEVMA
jgi:hypothetical protein